MYNFSFALEQLKLNNRITRASWNNTEIWLTIVTNWNGNFKSNYILPKDWKGFAAWIVIYDKDNYVKPYNLTNDDILANDWVILPD